MVLAGGLMVVGLGALPSREERPLPAADQKPPNQAPAAARGSASRHSSNISSGRALAARTDDVASWSEEEKEGLRIRANQEPRAAAEWTSALPAGARRRFALAVVALAWGASDPAAAAQWAGRLSDETERTEALAAIASEAVRSEPILALELACSLPDAAMTELVPRAVMEWAVGEPVAAADWAGRISSVSLRATALAGIAVVWSERDPSAAATMAVQELPAGRLQADTIVSIVQRWGRQAPEEATAWVDQFPAGDLRDAAMESLPAGSSLQGGVSRQVR